MRSAGVSAGTAGAEPAPEEAEEEVAEEAEDEAVVAVGVVGSSAGRVVASGEHSRMLVRVCTGRSSASASANENEGLGFSRPYVLPAPDHVSA